MAIQQHPLPQDISSYRFRLIGDMTIKQFASLGVSIVLAIIVYSLPLPFFFKYPLSFLFIVLGVGMAFVPVQGRSLDIWILAFIRSIYSPTQYIWKRSEKISEDMALPTGPIVGTQAVSNARIELSTGATATSPQPSTNNQQPITPIVPITPASIIETNGLPQLVEHQATPIPPVSPSTSPLPVATPIPITSSEQTANISAPATLGVSSITTSDTKPIEKSISSNLTSEIRDLPVRQAGLKSTESITPPVSHLPIPFTPTSPNTLVGLTLTPEGKILEGVLVEIQKNGITSRATKSNKLGQFMFARPLENGLYQILAEKEDFSFSPYSLDLTGAIIRPLKIQAI
ncbi:MAG: hypothetical protein UW64_C0007G0017 [Microgenomates group bacterium GW2011_GWC1_44_37]|uniref:Minus agglutinin n=1 Tax=Candidatus Collierbacteria bacterium GW2011_GWB2_44_22 TaxID=1618387 RepID=A0A0G1K4U4_9BACT|nr:MAG: hypothetical protein UW31_C0006G0016 [Candidatus Collierbacteria bacterium GW2011_GWA2_44_13]KKT51297.1 MAG: hypothetical protein UW44_C0013G0017 [Candidatus Collierbacteria bacterium GW2011_GWB2_44_22]KKT61673.1 MAG: hypothetical protein UW56_C0022G0016 [Candidatus Collierbacteria bacterium GW2011_GWD1_44_27]KKT65505.1 MAG: hypothetical protein UW58_C0028G0002 [Candidatus Collierbacteria bacterium GW2011_GWC2_44_30]KKT68931.1 MAG: hypothetical protein UW64_C0007G0017 [Microgenomates gr